MVSFEDRAPNVKANLSPAHGNTSVNMVDGCPGNFRVLIVSPRECMIVKRDIQKLMDENVIQIQQSRDMGDDVNVIVPVFKTPKRVVIQFDSSSNSNIDRSVSLLVIRFMGPVPYASDKAMPHQYNATMIENGQEVPLPVADSVVNIIDIMKVTRSGRVFSPVFLKVVEDVSVSKKAKILVVNPVSAPMYQSGESSKLKTNDDDEFDHIVANITSCNNLSFCDEELPEEGRNHNLALHILINCKENALSNMLVGNGSSLNVLPKSTLSRLSYQGAPMRYNGVVVKVFDDSRKTVIGEVDLQVKIGSSDFHINFQVMDIHPAYSFLLGRPWIHEARAVTSTLHQKLKFVKNDKLVLIGGKKALLVSHLSSFTYVDAKEEVGTPF
ncbi:hypothetical protein KIW84_041758 [Lathyrus oleraceus]|uniref:Uncharacterized protein n=1 Tax=Pisum sativum TaxID=3888 RepID=A0A9D4X9G1_PEA|nr:hypothetical protein KIW84_041758 [Pisum sativum]